VFTPARATPRKTSAVTLSGNSSMFRSGRSIQTKNRSAILLQQPGSAETPILIYPYRGGLTPAWRQTALSCGRSQSSKAWPSISCLADSIAALSSAHLRSIDLMKWPFWPMQSSASDLSGSEAGVLVSVTVHFKHSNLRSSKPAGPSETAVVVIRF
jgi:hypothetical protein